MRIVVAGGGVGGMTVALALQKAGHSVAICEQAGAYGQIGADVNLTPNAVHALDGLGLRSALEETAARPEFRISRTGDGGEETSRLPMSAAAEAKYGAPQLTIHRADLLDALRAALAPGTIRLGARAAGVEQDEQGAVLVLADGARVAGDLVIGADGIHSVVRAALFGPDHPRFTGLVSWRGTVPRERLAGIPDLDSFTKWWGQSSDHQIVTFPLRKGAEIFVFATTPLDGWSEEGWTLPGDVAELRAAYADFHPHARALLAACETVTRSALHVRDPMPQWSKGRVTVLGDAAHPMVPFMAQGACMAIEDGVVLARAVDANPDVPSALSAYEAARRERTARVQEGSLANDWLRQGGNADWVYAYDAWAVPVGDRQAA
ncbi:FAD-dependent monooxygenase [Aquibium microcysteis]|uniref:FAD-dependent monooxygenase n=1 Tax=Aquibium microcysteis TaxID=675281 RepID=UPI00165D20F5|nr:FAD-dependent monooxygenase [Aquibium microcysteis]